MQLEGGHQGPPENVNERMYRIEVERIYQDVLTLERDFDIFFPQEIDDFAHRELNGKLDQLEESIDRAIRGTRLLLGNLRQNRDGDQVESELLELIRLVEVPGTQSARAFRPLWDLAALLRALALFLERQGMATLMATLRGVESHSEAELEALLRVIGDMTRRLSRRRTLLVRQRSSTVQFLGIRSGDVRQRLADLKPYICPALQQVPRRAVTWAEIVTYVVSYCIHHVEPAVVARVLRHLHTEGVEHFCAGWASPAV